MTDKSERNLKVILDSIEGNNDVYINLSEDFPGLEDLKYPTSGDYQFKSDKFLGQDMISITKSDLEACYQANEPKLGPFR